MQDAQEPFFHNSTPATEWDRDLARRALDELFRLAGEYRTTSEYRKLLDFVGRFRFYSPYNAMLVHIQMPGAEYVAPPHRWLRAYGRHIKAGARPIVILQPMGPVMFVYDVSDTEPEDGAPPLPISPCICIIMPANLGLSLNNPNIITIPPGPIIPPIGPPGMDVGGLPGSALGTFSGSRSWE